MKEIRLTQGFVALIDDNEEAVNEDVDGDNADTDATEQKAED